MDYSEEDQQAQKQTMQYLLNISRKMSLSCPAASRFYMFNLKKSLENPLLNTKGIKLPQSCEHCGSLWSPTNHKVRIQPAPKKNNHIKKLMKWETENPWKLNNRQKKKILKYRESSNKIVYTCLCCKKSTKQPCFERKLKTKDKMTSLYLLPSKIKPKKRDLNAGLLISSQKNSIPPDTEENENHKSTISNCDTIIINSETPSFSSKELKLPPNLPPVINGCSIPKQHSSNLSKNKKKKSLYAQILKQEQETAKKKSSLSSFLISI